MVHTQIKNNTFPVGYHSLHPLPAVNFQLNRWISYLGESGLEDMRSIAPRLTDFSKYKEEFLKLAKQAYEKGRIMNAAYYYRSAEFFMWADDPMKKTTRQEFLRLIRQSFDISQNDYYKIPYNQNESHGILPAYRFTSHNSRGTILVHGGYDSYIEEFFPVLLAVTKQGYDIICFEGPGQGTALEDSGLVFTPDWHVPVKTVIDYFFLDNITLLGVSLGGCLALRAAAFEPRVRRVIAYDVCYDLQDVFIKQLHPHVQKIITLLLAGKAKIPFNILVLHTLNLF